MKNTNIIKTLKDIFEFEYHRFVKFEGEKKCYGYTVKYTHDGKERLNNPELFYPELFNNESTRKMFSGLDIITDVAKIPKEFGVILKE